MRRNVSHEIWTLFSRKVLQEKRADDCSRVQETPFYACNQYTVKGHAQSVCRIAEKLSAENALVTAGELAPNYLKLAQAEKEKLEKEGKI